MDQLTTVANSFVSFCQGIGIALLACMIALIALLVFTSFGNEHKQAIAKAAALGLLLGFALLMAAPTISTVIQRMFPAVKP
jgi:thiol:disulfide interchange protein